MDDPALADTSRVVSGLSNAVRYFWRVRARNAEGIGAYGVARAFTVVVAIPVLATPADQSAGLGTTVDFTWRRVSGATAYRIQVGTDQTFATGIFRDASVADTTTKVTGLSPATRYYWRLNASNAGGAGAFTAAWSFVTQVGVPVLLAPANSSSGHPTTVTMTWSRIAGASTYWLQLGTDPTFATGLVKNDSSIADTGRTVSGLGNGVPYYWRVSAKNGVGRSPFSATWSFRTAGLLPAQVVLVTPEQLGAVGKDSAVLRWRTSCPGGHPVLGGPRFRLDVRVEPARHDGHGHHEVVQRSYGVPMVLVEGPRLEHRRMGDVQRGAEIPGPSAECGR